MNPETVVMCVVALILGMLLSHMLKDVCGCNKVVEGYGYCGSFCADKDWKSDGGTTFSIEIGTCPLNNKKKYNTSEIIDVIPCKKYHGIWNVPFYDLDGKLIGCPNGHKINSSGDKCVKIDQ